jgi:hypothetical protein
MASGSATLQRPVGILDQAPSSRPPSLGRGPPAVRFELEPRSSGSNNRRPIQPVPPDPTDYLLAADLKGAQTGSCSSPVLMQQTAEQVTSTHPAVVILADDGQPGGWSWPGTPERPVGTVAAGMLDLDPEHLLQMAAADEHQPVRHWVRTVPTQPSADGKPWGPHRGHQDHATSEPTTSLQLPENLASRSPSSNHPRRPWSPAPPAGSGPAGGPRHRRGWRSRRRGGPGGCPVR